jgi:hypothetical protein
MDPATLIVASIVIGSASLVRIAAQAVSRRRDNRAGRAISTIGRESQRSIDHASTAYLQKVRDSAGRK